ncbi:MAG TPA: S8 family peptidase [Casimicrobiaceae bacterium]|nr:S8 family peptidase [Casimicrobiaceae bacterium]
MKSFLRFATSLLLAACITLVAWTVGAQTSTGDSARVIVKLKSTSALLSAKAAAGTSAQGERAKALGAKIGLATTAGAAIADDTQVVFASGISSHDLAQRLQAQDDVEYAVPDERRYILAAPNDPLYAAGVPGNGPAVGQWYLRKPDAAVASSIDIETAWSVTTGNPGVVVAVLDTGVRFEHPDLLAVAAGGNLLPGYDMITNASTANDGDGRDADASDPGDWVTAAEIAQSGGPFAQCATSAHNSSWHGSQTSGLIAALANNGIGMAGAAPHVRILPVRVLGKCGGFDSDIIAGMRWAAGISVPGVPSNANRAQVINMSLGASGSCSQAYRDAIAQITSLGTVIVASAGNSAGHSVGSPANCDGVIAVAALRHVGTKVGFSDLGSPIAISAPGGNCINVTAGSACLYPILTTSNSGPTTPAGSIWTDSFNPSLGTSFSAPLVSATAALVMSVQPSLTPLQVRLLLQQTARAFPYTPVNAVDGTPVPLCTAPQFDTTGNPIDQLECNCTIDTCGAGMLDAGAAVLGAQNGLATAALRAEGLWWASPGGSESGWGLNVVQQGNVIFATWFTYDVDGKPWWLSMTAVKTASNPDAYAGQLFQSRGPGFNAVPFDANQVTRTTVGLATLTFNDFDRATFAYTVNGVTQSKSITRQAFGPLPKCAYGTQPDFASAANYQDLWWAASGLESGWGVNITQQGDVIFATWFTYDVDGAPLWLSTTTRKTGTGVYGGDLVQTSGPPFSANPFSPALVTRNTVGSATFAFANGNAGTFTYTLRGFTQSKAIARQLFAPPAGTLCQ